MSLYAYGIVGNQSFWSELQSLEGIENQTLKLLTSENGQLVYSEILDLPAFKKQAKDFSTSSLIQQGIHPTQIHQKNLGEMIKMGTVLPFSYFSIFKDISSAKEFLRDYQQQLKSNLVKLESLWEYGLSVFWEKENFAPTNSASQEKEIETGKSYLLKKKQEFEREERLIKTAKEFSFQITQVFEDLIQERKEKFNLPNKLMLEGNYLILKEYHQLLVENVKDLSVKFPDFKIRFTGPWAPFNFVNLK